MNTAQITRALALGVVGALATTAMTYAPASAAPVGFDLLALSQDGDFFQPSDYAAGDVFVQTVRNGAKVDAKDEQDLSYSWTFTPFGSSSSVTVPATGDDVQPTDRAGRFEVVMPIGQGPGTYSLKASINADTNGDDAVAEKTLQTFTVGNTAPSGSTTSVDGLAAAKPGEAQDGTVTIEDPNGDPIAGQVFTLTVDHGFFTTGDDVSTAEGALVGNLEQDGTTLTAVTDSQGEIPFDIGIARDGGFDDDGKVAASVTVAGGPVGSGTATWSTADPLNGQVAVRLSPAGEQDGPVNPTLAGNRTFFDVFGLDQFGNPVAGAEIGLTFPGNVGEFDVDADTEDVVSNFDTFGDVAITLLKAGYIDLTGTWEEAPSTVYDANSAPLPKTDKPVSGSLRSSTYEISFNASSFSMGSSVSDTVRVGTAVTQTVRAVDQQGNPIEGYQVRFLRFGPDATNGDVVATRTTNALGEATYSFIGTRRGRAVITAEVSDGNRRRELTGTAAFGAGVRARLAKAKSTTSADRMTVTTGKVASGARVDLYRVVKGVEKLVSSRKVNSKGTAAFKVRDRNRSKKTTYVAVVRSTSKSLTDRSNALKTR
ncbi:Ig-like domain-containing protein [Aeromicrobium fastidiosum]|uniref:Big-1 domain-containing protein n=1 Tax=Aeromicrobium fastidiosum TaxID=52699 RepID=A0A641ALS0_9ACTN|nr:hypothetical protein [Aeromicrobium fastidiosum]KAA1378224.1 hypothetical protein ESP62_007540 [Aeromicrobium fastidiosum]MBP2388965.1 hypothetical protein [Aeromicrobium fastidiosum]